MFKYVIDQPTITTIRVQGENARYPVRRIFCVGRNYAAHAREMGKDPDRDPPFFFMKPTDAAFDSALQDKASVPYPPLTSNFHYEAELTVAIGKGGVNITESDALEHVFGYATSIDLTRRDLQLDARDKGRPWDWGKAFDLSAPIGPICRAESATELDLETSAIKMFLDEQEVQSGKLGELIWSVPEIIATISRSVELKAGDLIMTGTPAGVGPAIAGQTLRVEIGGLPDTVTAITDSAAT